MGAHLLGHDYADLANTIALAMKNGLTKGHPRLLRAKFDQIEDWCLPLITRDHRRSVQLRAPVRLQTRGALCRSGFVVSRFMERPAFP
nr:hypothetical protein [Salinibacterium sp. M195]